MLKLSSRRSAYYPSRKLVKRRFLSFIGVDRGIVVSNRVQGKFEFSAVFLCGAFGAVSLRLINAGCYYLGRLGIRIDD